MESTVMISSLLCNILIGCFCIMILSWAAVAIQTLFNDRRDEKRKEADEKRKEASEARELEYHNKRMEAYK